MVYRGQNALAKGLHASGDGGERPRKRRLLSQKALDSLRLLKNPPVKIRFEIVEVVQENGEIREVRHLPNAFAMEKPYPYG